ncbi:hypothetical protein KI387_005161, partial [Taxus chinensis]
IQAQAAKVALEFTHLKELLNHWGSAPCTVSRVPPNPPIPPPRLSPPWRPPPMNTRQRSRSHSRHSASPRARSTALSVGPGWILPLRGKGIASTPRWGSPPTTMNTLVGSPPPTWGIMVPLQT